MEYEIVDLEEMAKSIVAHSMHWNMAMMNLSRLREEKKLSDDDYGRVYEYMALIWRN